MTIVDLGNATEDASPRQLELELQMFESLLEKLVSALDLSVHDSLLASCS